MCFDDGGHFSQVVPLRPAGNEMRLTYANRNEWCDAVERLRVEECAEQVAAVRGGMGVIVPLDGLALFTAAELETMVCGDADWDVEFLKKNTELRGIPRNDARIGFLWDALGGFSKEERSLFLQFVWGRSRMPSSLPDTFKVGTAAAATAATATQMIGCPQPRPASSRCTCPRTPRRTRSRRSCEYAIWNGRSIDLDGVNREAAAWDAGADDGEEDGEF